MCCGGLPLLWLLLPSDKLNQRTAALVRDTTFKPHLYPPVISQWVIFYEYCCCQISCTGKRQRIVMVLSPSETGTELLTLPVGSQFQVGLAPNPPEFCRVRTTACVSGFSHSWSVKITYSAIFFFFL